LIPAQVVECLAGKDARSTGLVLEFQGFGLFQRSLESLIFNVDPKSWTSVKDFTHYRKGADPLSPELAKTIEKAREILKKRKTKSLYEVLGVLRSASRKEMRDVYFEHTREFHPDRIVGDLSDDITEVLEAAYQSVSFAYDVLKDDRSKKKYDLKHGIVVRAKDETSEQFRAKKTKMAYDQFRRKHGKNIEKGERLFEDALTADKKGDRKAAITNIKIALTYDPLNGKYKKKLRELEK
jgi:hypothetical protein